MAAKLIERGCRHVAKLLKLASETRPTGPSDVDAHIQRCLRQAPQLQSSDLKDLARSMAQLHCRDETSWQQLGSVVKDRVEDIKLAELVRIAGSFSVASQSNPEMLQAMMARIKESHSKLSCWSWADFMFSLQTAKTRPDEQLVKAAADAWLTDVDSLKTMNSAHIVALVEATLTSRVFTHGMLLALSGALMHCMDRLKANDLSRVAVALGQAACKDEGLVEALCKALNQNFSAIPTKRISWTLHGLSFVNCKDKELLTKLAVAWATSGPEKPVEVVYVMSALARLGILDPTMCNQIGACSVHCVPDLNARNIATILRLCFRCGCTHVEFLEALGRVADDKISEFSAMDLNEVALPAAKLSLAPILGDSISAAVVELVSEFQCAQLSRMMLAVARLSDTPGEFLPALERAVLPHVRTLNPADLWYLSLAWSETRVGDRSLMDAVAARAVEVMGSLDPSTINNLAWTYSTLQVTNGDLFEALGQRCSDTVYAFATSQLGYTAFAFISANFHNEMALVSIARNALVHLGRVDPVCASLLARAFIQADLESTAITGLLEGLAVLARQKGWMQLEAQLEDRRTDFQKQCAEVVREFLPSVMVSRRHQMGPVLALALEQSNRIPLNLEVDTVDQELSNLDVVVRSRRDEFLETLGVEVLRFKVKDLNDLRYDLQQIFGESAEPTDLQGPDLGAQDESEAPTVHQSLQMEMEHKGPQSQFFL